LNLPQIGLSYSESLSSELFDEFIQCIKTDKLDFQIEARENHGPFASIEWLIPSAVVIFISKSYFDTFLKEMGKDHYNLLKSGLKKLWIKVFGPKAPKYHIISTKGKSESGQPYSLLFSIYAEAKAKFRFKLLLQKDISEQAYNEIIESFTAFLLAYHAGNLGMDYINMLNQARNMGGTIFIAYNFELKKIECLNPISNKIKN